jgi:hypothetical protein
LDTGGLLIGRLAEHVIVAQTALLPLSWLKSVDFLLCVIMRRTLLRVFALWITAVVLKDQTRSVVGPLS